MVFEEKRKSEYVVVDTSAFIRNADLQNIGEKIITVPEVVNEIKSKRQLRRLVVLPYDLQIKEAFPENLKHVTEFSKKTGDFPSLSSTDLKVLALTYQLEKEHVGVEHLRTAPEINRTVEFGKRSKITAEEISGFYKPKQVGSSKLESDKLSVQVSDTNDDNGTEISTGDEELNEKLDNCNIEEDVSEYLSACDSSDDEFTEIAGDLNEESSLISDSNPNANSVESSDITKCGTDITVKENTDTAVKENTDTAVNYEVAVTDIFRKVTDDDVNTAETDDEELNSEKDRDDDDDDDAEVEEDDGVGWITPGNITQIKLEMGGENLVETPVTVACLTTDFAMQNVLKQIGLNVLSLDGRVIKQMRTFILRCYACFKTTSVMTKVFCHHCGNKTLKKVAVSVDDKGNQNIHINLRRPLTARGKKYSLPKPTGGKHSNYPLLFEDQRLPDQRPTRLGKTKNNPLDDDYIAGFSPFVMRDVNSKSAMLGIPNKTKEVKHWMRKNPNDSCGKRRKKK